MLIIKAQINVPAWQVIGVKEDLAMCCERHGDMQVISIVEQEVPEMEQMTIGGGRNAKRDVPWLRR